MSKLDQIVYTIDDGKIIESKIRDLNGFIETTTTPRGVGPVYHVRGTELWTWGHCGNFPRLVKAYDTEQEALDALENSFLHDFWNYPDICAFSSRTEAENALNEF